MDYFVFILMLVCTILVFLKIPYGNFGIHFLLIPLFSLILIGSKVSSLKDAIIHHRKAFITMALFYLWIWVSAFRSEYQITAVRYSIMYSYYLPIFIAFLVLSFKNHDFRIYYRLIFYFLLCLSIFGIIEQIYPNLKSFQIVRPGVSPYPRIASLMQNPNPFGVLMSLGVFLGILLYKARVISRLELYPASTIFMITVFGAGSRNAFLVLAVGVTLLFLTKVVRLNKNLSRILLITALLVLLLFLINKATNDKIMSHIAKQFPIVNVSTYSPERFLLWERGMSEFIKHPVFGIGIEVFPKHIGPQILGPGYWHVHDIFLNLLVELGAVGLVLFLLLTYHLLKMADFRNPLVSIPIILILTSQAFDYFFHDATFATVSFYFLAYAANSKKQKR